MDLGSLFSPQPQVQAAPNPELKSQWDGWLSDPANKAGLLSFGLQAMAGGWGNGTQQLSAALGAGAESAGGMQKMQFDKELEERRNNESRADKEASRSLQRELNDADNKAAMERTKAAKEGRAGSYDRSEQSYWDRMSALKLRQLEARNKAARDPLNKQLDPTLMELSEEEMIIEADRFADELVAKRRGDKTGGTNAGEKTSEISADSKGSVGMPPDTKTPASEPPSGAINKKATIEQPTRAPNQPIVGRGGPGVPAKREVKKRDIRGQLQLSPLLRAKWANPAERAKMMSEGWYDGSAE